MKKLLLVLLLVGWCGVAYPAELLVKASGHWMDELTQSEVDKMTPDARQSYDARSQKGDIVVVRPDGWKWGKEECLPNYIVVKVPEMTEAEAKKYEEPLTEEVVKTVTIDGKDVEQTEQVMVRFRKIALPQTDVTACKTGTVSLTKTALTSKEITKTGLASEISAPVAMDISYYTKKFIRMAQNWFVPKAYAATQLKKTVKPSGGDYTSLEACMNANEQNLVTADKYFDVEIDGTWSSADTSAVTIHNYPTDATRYINIYTTATARHHGVWSTSYYNLTRSSDGGQIINIGADYIYITGLQISNTTTGSSNYTCGVYLAASNCNIQKCIIKSAATGGTLSGTFCGNLDGGNGNFLINSVIIATSSYAFQIVEPYNNATCISVLNCIFIGNTAGNVINGYYGSSAYKWTFKNCYVSNVGAGAAYTTTGIQMTTCAADDTTGTPDTLDSIAYSTSTFTSVTGGSEDFHLVAGSALIDVGTDLSATFTDDIDGVTRAGTWDIGADEYVAAGGSAVASRNAFGNGIGNGISRGAR